MKPLKALLVEDSDNDAALLLRHLFNEGFEVESAIVQTAADMKTAIAEQSWDIILSDYVMPSFSGLDVLTILKENGLDIPIIIISGTIGEGTAVEAMLHGVNDYLMKDNLTRLAPAIERELENAAKRQQQRQAEENLEELVKRERAMIENSLDIICSVDAEGRFVTVSPACFKVLGYLPEELIGRNYIDLVAPEDVTKTNEVVDSLMSGNETINFENRYLHKSGSLVDIMWASCWSEKEQMIFTVAHDNTEQKRIEEKLKARETQLNEAQAVAHLGSWEWTVADNKVAWSNELYRIFGLKPQELDVTLETYLSFVHPDDREYVTKTIKQTLCDKTFYEIDNRIIQPDGTVRVIRGKAIVILDENGSPVKLTGTSQDITEQKHAEDAVRESERRLFLLLDAMPVGVFVIDGLGNPYYSNNVSQQILEAVWKIG